jgi:preprotein translocase subunit SecF
MNTNQHFDFMRYRHIATALSIVLLLLSLASLMFRGLNLGLDFTGGTVLELAYEKPVNLEALRSKTKSLGFDASVVNYGSELNVLMRVQTDDKTVGQQIIDAMQTEDNGGTLLRSEFVGPQIGEELRDQGGLALLAALIVVMMYVAIRFQYKFSFGSVVALMHDVIISLGVFSFFQWDFDLTVLAALLAIIGYSLNDTIVVFDRVRENFLSVREGSSKDIINISLTQMLGRTMVTSLTTLFVVVVLFLFGGAAIQGFSKALIIGIVIGTYSSIYVATNILLSMHIDREDLLNEPKEGDEFDDSP